MIDGRDLFFYFIFCKDIYNVYINVFNVGRVILLYIKLCFLITGIPRTSSA